MLLCTHFADYLLTLPTLLSAKSLSDIFDISDSDEFELLELTWTVFPTRLLAVSVHTTWRKCGIGFAFLTFPQLIDWLILERTETFCCFRGRTQSGQAKANWVLSEQPRGRVPPSSKGQITCEFPDLCSLPADNYHRSKLSCQTLCVFIFVVCFTGSLCWQLNTDVLLWFVSPFLLLFPPSHHMSV